MDSKKLLLIALVIAAGVAFAYFDPMDLDLLGLKQKPVAATAAIPHVPKPVAKPAVNAPKAATAPTQTKVAAAAPTPPAATSPAVAPATATVPVQLNTPSSKTSATPSPAAPPPAPPVAQAVEPKKPPMKLSKETKAESKPLRPKNLDLRYCLDLETDAAIAKCAGE